MDKVKKIIFLNVPLSICNLRCHYCYIAQRKECYQGIQPVMHYSPQQVGTALSKKRVGGPAFINVCAQGETLLLKDLDLYLKALLEEGHYIELVTNLTVTPMLDRILALDAELLSRLEFKCSFHYLELKKKNWLVLFANNVHKIWEHGASATIELTPSDELVPYIDEVKSFCMEQFGALCHLTITRDDSKRDIDYLTQLPMEEYDRIWGSFNSGFWQYKKSIFKVKQKSFCYAGSWSMHIDLSTGEYKQCLRSLPLLDVFAHPEKPLPELPVCSCHLAHCYNGHALLTFGVIPCATDVGYGEIRNRIRSSDVPSEWLQPNLRDFFNGKLMESNRVLNAREQTLMRVKMLPFTLTRKAAILFWGLKMKKR